MTAALSSNTSIMFDLDSGTGQPNDFTTLRQHVRGFNWNMREKQERAHQ